jgi:hypothetical protein
LTIVCKAGPNGCVHVAGSPQVTITGNVFDCDGVSNNVIWLQARRAVLVDHTVIHNTILNYGRVCDRLRLAYGVDYATVRGNVFRSAPGASGVTRAGRGTWCSHTSVAHNTGP